MLYMAASVLADAVAHIGLGDPDQVFGAITTNPLVLPPWAPGGRLAVTILTLAGGAAFWIANFAISPTSIAADYRAALSISYVPMLLEALLGGLVIGLGVSAVLLRFFDRVPGRDPLRKSLLLSIVALLIVTLLIQVPSALSTATSDALRYFVIGMVLNAIRILALGAVIGSVYRALSERGRLAEVAPGPEVEG